MTENPAKIAEEAYRRAKPHREAEVDRAYQDSEAEAVAHPLADSSGSPPQAPEAASEGLHCCECGAAVHPIQPDVLREVIGWAKPREQGGQNHVRFRRETGRLMCPRCATLLQYAGHTGQETLL